MAKKRLIILFDGHIREVTGCYGNEFIHTPNLDAVTEQ